MLDTLPPLHCFGRLFSTYNRRAIPRPPAPFPPLAFAVPHRRPTARGIASDIRHIRGSLCFMANCFIIFDIFPVYGRGSAFCFMAVYCTWWTSLYVPPWIIPRPTPRLVFHPRDARRVEYDKRHFFMIKMRSAFSHRLVEKYICIPFDSRYENVIDCLSVLRSL